MGDETCSVYLPIGALETSAERYFVEQREEQRIPGAVRSPATSFEPGKPAAASSASFTGDNSD